VILKYLRLESTSGSSGPGASSRRPFDRVSLRQDKEDTEVHRMEGEEALRCGRVFGHGTLVSVFWSVPCLGAASRPLNIPSKGQY
jgi:hypothetical protein